MTETVSIRTKTRRVKDHILNRYLALADKVDKGEKLIGEDKTLYNSLTATFSRNVIPAVREHGGDPENRTPIPILGGTTSPSNEDQGTDSGV